MRKAEPLVLMVSLQAALACDSSETASPATACTPYETQACLGVGACRGGQLCLSDGSGWTACDCGSIAASDGPTALACGAEQKVSTLACDDNVSIRQAGSKYWINDNVWGRTTGDTDSMQCIWLGCESADVIAWGTSWSWKGSRSSVKAYPSIIFGWSWGLKIQDTGLPVALYANHSLTTGWRFTVRPSGEEPFRMNVSYDLWLHVISTPDASNVGDNVPTDEVMVWLYRTDDVTPLGGPVVSGIPLAGTTWDLWEGQANPWMTHSFVRTELVTNTELDLRELLGYLVSERGLDGRKFLTSIQAGSEVFVGSGQLETSAYYVRVQ